MSSDRLQIGVMGVVLDREIFDKHNDLDDNCINENDQLFFNYDGTLTYMIIIDVDDGYGFSKFINLDENIKLKDEFQSKLLKNGVLLETMNYKTKFFVNSWYDGSDNPIDMMSIEDFINS